ncbi:MAG TPA: hypothetical protein VGL87_03370, partial [Steroidobacteraceae bacterium]
MKYSPGRRHLVSAAIAGITVCASICTAPVASSRALASSAAPRPPAPAASPAPSDHLSYGRFNGLSVYSPAGPSKSFVLLLSGAEGWNSQVAVLARQLAERGALVAGIDLPKLDVNLAADGGDCAFLDGDLENLSHFLQAYYHVPTYLPPFLVGYQAGAVLAYATLVQAPAGTFAGALTVGFSPATHLRKPLCKGS